MQYYYSENDQQKGPVDVQGLKAAGVTAGTLVWREGMSQWLPVRDVTELASLLSLIGAEPLVAAGEPVAPEPHEASTDFSAPGADAQPSPFTDGYDPSAPAPVPYAPAGYPQQNLQYSGYGTQTAPSQQGLAVASLVLGILAIPTTFCYGFGLLFAILAIIFGHIAYSQSKKLGQANGMAMAGLICGYISLGLVVVLFLFIFVMIGAAAVN